MGSNSRASAASAAAESKKRKPTSDAEQLQRVLEQQAALRLGDIDRARAARVGATLSSILSRVPGISIIDAWKQSLLKTMHECDPLTGYPRPIQTAKEEAATRAAMEAAKLPFKRRDDDDGGGGGTVTWKFRYPERVAASRPDSPTF